MSIESGGPHFGDPENARELPKDSEADLKGDVEKAKLQGEHLNETSSDFQKLIKDVKSHEEQKVLEDALKALSGPKNDENKEEQKSETSPPPKHTVAKESTPRHQSRVAKRKACSSSQEEPKSSSPLQEKSPSPHTSSKASPTKQPPSSPQPKTNEKPIQAQQKPFTKEPRQKTSPATHEKKPPPQAAKEKPPASPQKTTQQPHPTANKQTLPTNKDQHKAQTTQQKPSSTQQERVASRSSSKQAQETKQQSDSPQEPRSQAQVKSQGGAQQAQAPARNTEAQRMEAKPQDPAQQAANLSQANTAAASQQQTTNKQSSPTQNKRSDGKQEAQAATGLRASQVVAGTGQSDTNSDSQGGQQDQQQTKETSSTSQSSKGGAEELYGSKYKLRTSDTMDAEFLAMDASYEADKVKKSYESHEHMLEVKAQEYAQYVSEYMQGVRGITMHAFDGHFSFSNDMTPNKPTSAYQKYLAKVRYYQEQYEAAEAILAQYEPQVQLDCATYRMAYDQYEMMYSINQEVMSAYNSIDMSAWKKKIANGQATVQQAAKAIEDELNKLISQLEAEKDKKGKPIPGAQDAARALQKIEDNLKGTLSAGGSIDISSILSQIQDALKQAGPNLPSSLSSILSQCKGLLDKYQDDVNNVNSLRSSLRSKLQHAFSSIEKTIESDLKQLESDNKNYASELGFSSSSGNPFVIEEKILKTLLSKVENAADGGSIPSMESGLSGLNSACKIAQNKLEQSSAHQRYISAQNTYKSELSTVSKYSALALSAKKALENYEKNHKVPPDKRWSSVSNYGYATQALDQYKILVNEVNFNPSGSSEFSQTVSKGPRQVDGSPIPEWWKIKNKDWSHVKSLEREISVLKDLRDALAIAVAASCGMDGGADAELIVVEALLSSAEDSLSKAKSAYQSAYQTYMNFQHELPVQQNNNNESWKSKITQQAQTLSQQFNRKIAQTRLKEQEADKAIKKEVQNIQKILNTYAELASNKAQATTQSFL